MASGSCLCGTVRWAMEAPFEEMSHCHCSMCRKVHGVAFGTYLTGAKSNFQWLGGENAITRYASSPGFMRAFCGTCGSVVPDGLQGEMFVPAGCLDDDPGILPTRHIFFASKAPWHQVVDSLPRHDEYSGEDPLPSIERPVVSAPAPGTLRGSCLCGDVAYEVVEPLKAVHNCHCSRCRKARAAAHATNGFTSIDGLRFVRGEDRLVTYKLPDARFFTQVFCRTCGSGMPRFDAGRGIAIIPMGSLDDDPGRGADDHIFVASRAPWYEIGDDLPQFEEAPG
jgi:hypothetical protein